jgi:NADH-quinone oxidoreductase chain G
MAEQQAELISLTIDGRAVSVPKGTLIWEAARRLGIEIPIYCYHPKMEPLGACRMCFVGVKGLPKPATACTTVVAPDMEVTTTAPQVQKARRGTLEFLLLNHPLDCPICDKGGECDLQDFTLRYGPGASRFDLRKRHFEKPIPVSEHILLDRERCIACQRCVRFCQTVAMENGLVMEERGFKTEVGVDPQAPFDSIFSGNVVEMCPVGALTAKSYRFVTRPWELRRTASVCGNCSVGCNVSVDVRVDKVLRQYSRTNDAIDDGWLCDRGRWGLDWINSQERLRKPLIRRNGLLQPATWEEAITEVATRLREIEKRRGPQAIGGIGSTHTTNEEAYLFQKLLRAGLGTNNVDHFHGRFPAPREGDLPWAWTDSLAGLDRASHIVLLGANPYERQPIVDLRIRKAIRRGARVHVLTPEPNRLDRLAAGTLRYAAGQTGTVARALLGIVAAEAGSKPPATGSKPPATGSKPPAGDPAAGGMLARGTYAEEHSELLAQLRAEATDAALEKAAETANVSLEELRALAREIASSDGAVLLYDEMATLEPSGAALAEDVLTLALLTGNFGRLGAGAGPLFEDNNSLGARDMGLLPDLLPGYRSLDDDEARDALAAAWGRRLPLARGLTYDEMLAGRVSALWVMGADPARHLRDEQLARLEALDFLVVQDLYLTETARRAHVVLPALAYTEKDGTFTNTERCVQVVRQAMQPLPQAKADWEILVAVARGLGLGWAYLSPAEILSEIGRTTPLYAGASRRALGESGARWPLAPGGRTPEGRTTVAGSETLTWEMLAGWPPLTRGPASIPSEDGDRREPATSEHRHGFLGGAVGERGA